MAELLDVVTIDGEDYSVVGKSHGSIIRYDLMSDRRHKVQVEWDDNWVIKYRHSGPIDGLTLKSFGTEPFNSIE